MRYCKNCEAFGKNLDKGNINWCWDGGFSPKDERPACIAFREREESEDNV